MSTSMIFEDIVKYSLDRKEFIKRMGEILHNVDNIKIERFTDKLYSLISEHLENENFVRKMIKGESHREIEIDKLINRFCGYDIVLKAEEKNKIHDLIQELLSDSLNELQIFEYATNTFPLFSYLKRELLETRTGTNEKQWEFILKNSKRLSNDFYEKFKSISHYREIDDKTCARMISAVIFQMTNKRFDNNISQPHDSKGWFPNGLLDLPVQKHDIKQKDLFLIAYSLKFDITKYIEMQKRNEDLYDVFCYEDNMYRFALKFIDKKGTSKSVYNYIEDIINKHVNRFESINNTTLFSKSAENRINAFLNDEANKNMSIDTLVQLFIDLQEQLGVSTAKNREEIWNIERRKIASESLYEILDFMDVRKIKEYFKLYYKENSTIKLKDLIVHKKNKEHLSQSDMIVHNLNENYFDIIMSTEKTKERLLHLISDGNCDSEFLSYVHRTIRPILATKFTTNRINAIKENDESKSLTITRNDILRIGYLKTFTEFVNQGRKYNNKKEMMKDTPKIIERFEVITNELLRNCHYADLHITFPHDCLIYVALSSLANDRCIPDVYQLCLPMKNLNQDID